MKGFLLLMEKEYADMSTYVKLMIIRLILIKRGGGVLHHISYLPA